MSTLDLLSKVQANHPDITFIEGDIFMWSPSTLEVQYSLRALESTDGSYSLLHELAHALLAHTSYTADTELIQLEIEAWAKASKLGAEYSVDIPEDYIQDCLDSYRDWLLKRASCPSCSVSGIQSTRTLEYECINCGRTWSVPTDQTCSPRRSPTN